MNRRLSLMTAALLALLGCGAWVFAGPTAEGGAERVRQVELTVMLNEGSATNVNPEAPSYRVITAKTGVKINFQPIPSSDYTQKIRTLIATNNVPDIALIGSGELIDFGASGAFLELDSYIDRYAPEFKRVMAANPWIKKLTISGKLYAFPTVSRDDVTKSPLMFTRVDLLKRHAIGTPKTVNDLYSMLKALKTLYPDSLPYTSRGSGMLQSVALYSLGSGQGIYYDKDVDGGRYVYAPTSPQYRRAVEYLARLYKEQLLDPDYAVTSNQQWQEKNGSGKGLFSYDNPIFMDTMNKALEKTKPGARFAMIPVVATETGMRRFQLYVVHPARYWVIGAKTKDPVAAVRLFNWLYSEDGCNVRNFGILGEHYTIEGGKPTFKPSYLASFAGRGDLYTLVQNELGVAYNNFTPYLDNTLLKVSQTGELQKWWFVDVAADPARDYPELDPPFTAAERQKIKDIRSALSTLEKESFDKFVMGAWPISQFEQVVKQMNEKGAAELEAVYNRANAAAR